MTPLDGAVRLWIPAFAGMTLLGLLTPRDRFAACHPEEPEATKDLNRVNLDPSLRSG